MRVLVACEFSGRVRDAFLARGHDAWSCDLDDADFPNPNYERHLKRDVRPLLQSGEWDLIIAHPPCTYLCNSGVRWLGERKGRMACLVAGAEFFLACLNAVCPRVCVENPVMHGYAKALIPQAPAQIIQPYQFGEPESKATCLWLKGLPPLKATNTVAGRKNTIHNAGGGHGKERSRTFVGIAQAMAEQWG